MSRSSARARRAAASWLRRDSPRPRASSVRRFPGARARGRGCCIRLRSRWACDVPLRASLSPLSADGERDPAGADKRPRLAFLRSNRGGLSPGADTFRRGTGSHLAGKRYMSATMRVDGRHTRSIWLEDDGWSVGAIDQSQLPHRFATIRLTTLADAARATATRRVRGAPLIGATAAYGVCLALRADTSDAALERAYATLLATRPTAINLKWALDEMVAAVRNRPREERVAAAYKRAAEICDEDVAINEAIGRHGLKLIKAIAARKPGKPVNVLTHCN